MPPISQEKQLEIVESLARLSASFDNLKDEVTNHFSHVEHRLQHLDEKLEKVQTCLQGTASHPGLLVRLDRLEQSEKRRAKLSWVAIGAAFAALSSVIAKAFRG